MPVDALPVPNSSQPSPGTATLRREYRDPMGRPMSGTATITGGIRSEDGHTVIVPAPLTTAIVGGVLEVQLQPGEYRIVAALRTLDGQRMSDTHRVTLEATT